MISEVDIKDMQPEKGDYPIPYTDLFPTNKVDLVNHPPHYTNHPSGVECIQITEHMGFLMGNAMKYLWRADLKNGIEDLEKAAWYIQREIRKRKENA
jgi:hypothetical protein